MPGALRLAPEQRGLPCSFGGALYTVIAAGAGGDAPPLFGVFCSSCSHSSTASMCGSTRC